MHYRFTEFQLHPASRSLRRDQAELDVPRKVFDCLVYLIEQRDRAAGRDELIAAVWHRSNVSDNQLAHAIAAARRLIDDDGTAQRFIRTVPGFGYRWVAPVEVIQTSDDEATNTLAEAEAAPDLSPDTAPDNTADDLTAYFEALELAYIPEPAPRRKWPLVTAMLLVPLLLAVLWWNGQGAHSEAATAATQALHETWVLPATLPDTSEAWARVGLMALVAEGMRRQGADVVPIEKSLARLGDVPSNGNLARLVRELDAGELVVPTAQRVGDIWMVGLVAHARDGSVVRVDARDTDLLAAGRVAVQRLNLRLGRSGALLDGSHEEAFELIAQAIRGRDFEGALSQLSRLSGADRDRPEAGLLEIELDLEKGRNSAAKEKVERWLERVDPAIDPVPYARLLLARVTTMRQLNLPGWAALVDQAIVLLQDADAPRDLGLALYMRGTAAIIADNSADATRDLIHAHRLLAEHGDELFAAKVTATMAQLALLEGRHSEALMQLEQSASVFEAHGAIAPLLASIRSTALLMADMLRWEDLLRITNRLRALHQTTDANSREQSSYLRLRGWALLQLGRLREADALLGEQEREIRRQLLDNRDDSGNNNVRLLALASQRAQLEIAQEQWARAANTAAEGFQSFWQLGQQSEVPRLQGYLDNLLLLQLRAQAGPAPWDALAPLPTLSPQQRQAMSAASTQSGLLARAYWNARHGDIASAERDYRAALSGSDSARQRFLASSDYIQFLLAHSRIEDASRELETLLLRDPTLVDRDYSAAILDLRVRLAQGDDARWQAAALRVLTLAGERQPPVELLPAIQAAQVATSHP